MLLKRDTDLGVQQWRTELGLNSEHSEGRWRLRWRAVAKVRCALWLQRVPRGNLRAGGSVSFSPETRVGLRRRKRFTWAPGVGDSQFSIRRPPGLAPGEGVGWWNLCGWGVAWWSRKQREIGSLLVFHTALTTRCNVATSQAPQLQTPWLD